MTLAADGDFMHLRILLQAPCKEGQLRIAQPLIYLLKDPDIFAVASRAGR